MSLFQFNWLDLVAAEDDRLDRRENGLAMAAHSAQLDPYASDDEEQMRALAK